MKKNLYFASLFVISYVYGGTAATSGSDAVGVMKEAGDIIKSFWDRDNKNSGNGGSGSGSGIMNFGAGAAGAAGVNGTAGVAGAAGAPGAPGSAGTTTAPQVINNYTITNTDNSVKSTDNSMQVGPDGHPLVAGQQMKGADGQILKDSQGNPVVVPAALPVIIDPTTSQPIVVPATGFTPGTVITGSNGQPIINPQTNQPYVAPGFKPGPLTDTLGQPVLDSTGKQVIIPAPQLVSAGTAGQFSAGQFSTIDDTLLQDPTKNSSLYQELIAKAKEDPETKAALEAIHDEMPERLANTTRAPILRKFLDKTNTANAQAAEAEALRKKAIEDAAAREAREKAEAIRREFIQKEINRLNEENARIIKSLQGQGVSSTEISAIMAKSRDTALSGVQTPTEDYLPVPPVTTQSTAPVQPAPVVTAPTAPQQQPAPVAVTPIPATTAPKVTLPPPPTFNFGSPTVATPTAAAATPAPTPAVTKATLPPPPTFNFG